MSKPITPCFVSPDALNSILDAVSKHAVFVCESEAVQTFETLEAVFITDEQAFQPSTSQPSDMDRDNKRHQNVMNSLPPTTRQVYDDMLSTIIGYGYLEPNEAADLIEVAALQHWELQRRRNTSAA